MIKYELDFSPLSSDEKSALAERIDDHSCTGIHWESDFQSAIFFIEENFDINLLNVPAECHLSRIS
mgnify:CR=1 FL=1